MRRAIKALLSGLSAALVFLTGCAAITLLAGLCEDRAIVFERLPRLTQWVVCVAPHHEWQMLSGVVLLLAGFGWLAWQANESPATVLYRGFIACMFAALCAMALPFLQGCGLHDAPPVTLASFVLPGLCAIPVLVAWIGQRRK